MQLALTTLTSASHVSPPGAVGEPFESRPPDNKWLDGFSMEQWAAYAKLKSRVASSVSKDNAKLKSPIKARPPYDAKDSFRHVVDPVFEADPWQAARATLGTDRASAKSSCDSVREDAWSKWLGSDTRLVDMESSVTYESSLQEKESNAQSVLDVPPCSCR